MKIIQVATLISPDASYGGPVTVALNQCRELLAKGHDVTLLAAASGFEQPFPTEIQGVPVKLFPARQVLPKVGFAGIAAPSMLAWLQRHAHLADVIHVHMARDFVTLPAALLAVQKKTPLYLQCHGMIDPSNKVLAQPLDLLLTRPILRRARGIFYLTPTERSALASVAGPTLPLRKLANGVPHSNVKPRRDDSEPEVLFLARLHKRKRPLLFVDAASELNRNYPRVKFALVGPDEGEGAEVAHRCSSIANTSWEGPLDSDSTLERMSRSSLYVLPSVDEPFPMSVLEAMSVGLPVIITESCGLAPAVASARAGLVVDENRASLVAAIDRLLRRPELMRELGANGRELVRTEYTMESIARELEDAYSRSSSAAGA
ncbi:glycosyltransferase [Pseudarthrobacter siccitolerans]|uniref:glycosyltransferase n=1 Tax=Pseudarthrobacter siccitolerans TaxID=861266 RepID=UPI0027BA5C3F|nr:glycosyltransferase [Pseudarthrobacter siccitolerans]